MATEQGRRPSFYRQLALKNIVRLIPAVVILAAMLNVLSCGSSGLLSPSDNSGSPTATPTTGTGSLAFVTNYKDGKVSSFTRNTTTGVLTLTGQVAAGAKSGPRGVVASPDGSFLYVANISDNNIYEYSIDSTNGTLTPLSPKSVSNGTGTQPDELAITTILDVTMLWVTGRAGTIKSYTVDSSTGQITLTGTTSGGGLQTPFGITLHPTLEALYVSDSATGFIYPFIYDDTSGALTPIATPQHSTDPNANTPAAIAIDSGGGALFIADQKLGEVSSFYINLDTAALTPYSTFPNISLNAAPVGVGLGVNAGGIEYLFTANSGAGGNSVSSFVVTNSVIANSPPAVVTGYTGATGLVVDPQNKFVYSANFGNGTVGQAIINNGTTCTIQLCAGVSKPTESPANANSGPFGITLAQ